MSNGVFRAERVKDKIVINLIDVNGVTFKNLLIMLVFLTSTLCELEYNQFLEYKSSCFLCVNARCLVLDPIRYSA